MNKVGKVALVAGAAIATMATIIGVKGVRAAVDFEKGMANVATLLDGDFKTRIKELGINIQDLMKQTGLSASTLQEGLYQTISALGDTADSMSILEIASKGAVAGNATVTDSVNLLSAVMKGYGEVSEASAKSVSDMAFQAVKLGQTTFPELASSMGKVIPLADTLKLSQEELFGAMATLTGVTGQAAEVSTQLRGILVDLMDPSEEMANALNEMGYETGVAAIEAEGLGGTLDGLKKSVNGNETEFANLFGRIEGTVAALALSGSQADVFTKKTLAMRDAVGSTDEAFERQQNTMSSSMARMKETFNVMLIKVGDELMPIIKEFSEYFITNMPIIKEKVVSAFKRIVEVAEKVISFFANLTDGQKDLIAFLLKTVLGISGLALVISKIIPIVIALKTAFDFLLLNPIILGIAAVVLAIAGIAYASTHATKKVKEMTDSLIELYKEEAEKAKKIREEIHNERIELLNEEISAVQSAYDKQIELLTKEKDATLAIEVEKLNAIKERKEQIEKDYEAEIKRINDEYGVYEVANRNKLDIARATAEEQKELLQSNYDKAIELSNETIATIENNYDAEVESARNAYDEKLRLLYESTDAEKALRNDATSEVIQELKKQIDAINEQTKAENNAKREADEAAKILDLESMIRAETDIVKRGELQTELEAYKERIAREAELRSREILKDSLRNKIDSERETLKESLKLLDDNTEEKATILKQELTDNNQRLEDKKIAAIIAEKEEQTRLTIRLAENKITKDNALKETLQRIEDERLAAIKAEDEMFKNRQDTINQSIKAQEDFIVMQNILMDAELLAKQQLESDKLEATKERVAKEIDLLSDLYNEQERVANATLENNIAIAKEEEGKFKNSKMGKLMGLDVGLKTGNTTLPNNSPLFSKRSSLSQSFADIENGTFNTAALGGNVSGIDFPRFNTMPIDKKITMNINNPSFFNQRDMDKMLDGAVERINDKVN